MPVKNMKFIYKIALFFLAPLVVASGTYAYAMKNEFLCGTAQGYPPYQFQNEAGEPTGLDVEVLRLVFEKMDKKLIFQQGKWDNIVGNLCFGDFDCVGGMEINETRKSCFDFTTPYYNRKIAIFLLADNTGIHCIDDLKWTIIGGDRHSPVEQCFKEQGLKNKIRIFQTNSKDESMQLLKEKAVVAVVMPKAVGFHLARKHEIDVRVLEDSYSSSPVGIAVKKGNAELLNLLEAALLELKREGLLDAVFKKWRIQ